jgi:hypothetical protein
MEGFEGILESKETALAKVDRVQELIDAIVSHERALSFSSLKQFAESPASFINYMLKQKVQTPAMLNGQMIHKLVLEPEEFDKVYFTFDDSEKIKELEAKNPGGSHRATKIYKEWKALQLQNAGDRVIVEPKDYIAAKIKAEAVQRNEPARRILNMCGIRERKIEWNYLNFRFKGFMDAYTPGLKGLKRTWQSRGGITDLKNCPDAEPKKFQRDIINNKYYLQAAMYLQGCDEDIPYYIIALDGEDGVSVHELSPDLIKMGMEEYAKLIEHFNYCVLSDGFRESYNFWAERRDGIFTAEKPRWL